MTSKKHKILSIVTSIALAMILCLGLALPALAYSTGTDADSPAEGAITKRLRMPINTVTPDATFTFKFTPIGIDEGTDPTGMPDITDKEITFSASDAATFTVGGDIYVVKESINILDGIGAQDWPREGIYKYQVEELEGGITLTGAPNEGEVYSKAKYDLEIWVEEDSQGRLFAKFVHAKTVKGFIDEYYVGDPGGEKVDPTPGGVKEKEEFTIEDDFSQVMFTNRYWTSNGGGPENPEDAALVITKEVTGNGAEKDRFFIFKITVTQPSAITAPQEYIAYLMDENNNILPIDGNYYQGTIYQDDDGNDYVVFLSGVEKGGRMSHGQKLVFVDLHVGASVTVEEAAVPGYTPQYQRTFAGTDPFKALVPNTPWGFPQKGDDGPHYIEAGANFNVATFTNIRTGATPMGIDADYLPYIALITVVLLATAGFAVFTFRKRAKDEV